MEKMFQSTKQSVFPSYSYWNHHSITIKSPLKPMKSPVFHSRNPKCFMMEPGDGTSSTSLSILAGIFRASHGWLPMKSTWDHISQQMSWFYQHSLLDDMTSLLIDVNFTYHYFTHHHESFTIRWLENSVRSSVYGSPLLIGNISVGNFWIPQFGSVDRSLQSPLDSSPWTSVLKFLHFHDITICGAPVP